MDQFGGPSGKKFMRRRFRELIVRVAKLPISEHNEEFSRVFDDWKSNEEQVDDVLIVSIRI